MRVWGRTRFFWIFSRAWNFRWIRRGRGGGGGADLAEAEEAGEDIEAEFVELLVGFSFEKLGAGALEFGLIELGLGAFHFDDDVLLDTLGQVGGDLGFRAAEQERPGAGGEAAAREDVVLAVEIFHKTGAVAEHAGHGELEDRPEIKEAVLDRRSGEREAVRGRQGAGGAGVL